MTYILVIRHAVTDWNAQGRIQGRTDVPLSDAGRTAAMTWKLPAGAHSIRWFASPLQRTMDTAREVGLSFEAEPRLAEMAWGEWEGKTLKELRDSGALTPAMEALGLDFRPPGGETPREVQHRVRPWLTEVAQSRKPAGAVTHQGVLRAIYALATGWDMKSKPPVKMVDACAQCFMLDPAGTPRAALLNIKL